MYEWISMCSAVDSYSCVCVAGFEGDMCETNIDDCSVNGCMNGSQCVDGDDSYTCDCMPGFEGEMCEIEIGSWIA
eukprot:UN23067